LAYKRKKKKDIIPPSKTKSRGRWKKVGKIYPEFDVVADQRDTTWRA
tara:strand:+ start:724 stop:864 length:141 start_codon:yes stop_codon:yes gene_type:complete